MGLSKKLWEKIHLEEYIQKCAEEEFSAHITKDSERSKDGDCEDNKKNKNNEEEG